MRRMLLWMLLMVVPACTAHRLIGEPSLDVQTKTIPLQRDKADILFMIDNSPSMAPKQAELRNRFPLLAMRLQELATGGTLASLHIGVITSDLGAGPFQPSNGQCHPGGDGARLQTGPAAAACANFTLTDGAPFIDDDLATGGSNVGGVDLPTAIGCLATVGDGGCGFESPLESVYQALTTPGLNPGFLRDDAVLVVVLLTDEDDCSAPPSTDLFDPSAAGVAQYGPLHSFRCTRFGIRCDGHPLDDTAGSFGACEPTSGGGMLLDVRRYQTLFTVDRAHGGVKDDPSQLLLVSLTGPPSPLSTTLTAPCADEPTTPTCTVLAHSCVAPTNPLFFADPAVRIHTVAQAVPNRIEASICDTDYSSVLDNMATALGARLKAGCLPGAVVDRSDPACTVTLGDKSVTRCIDDIHLPCWTIVDDDACGPHVTPAGRVQRARLIVRGVKPGVVPTATCPLYTPSI